MPDKVALPTEKIASSAIANTPAGAADIVSGLPVHDLSLIGMFMQSDMVVKFVILALFFASFWCWAIIFDKILAFKLVERKTNKFERSFWSGELLERIYEGIKGKANHPMAKIFVSAMREWKMQDEVVSERAELKVGLKERIFQAMSLVRNQELDKLERNINILATVGSTAPFVGLFGTVWGIMNSFQSIALAKNTTLAVVAPGIAEALFATAIGLFAAIPAVIFYNKFTSDVTRLANKLEDFSGELGAILSRELDKH